MRVEADKSFQNNKLKISAISQNVFVITIQSALKVS
jgi:hypothetical protein